MSCSTLRERASGSSPSASQVSLKTEGDCYWQIVSQKVAKARFWLGPPPALRSARSRAPSTTRPRRVCIEKNCELVHCTQLDGNWSSFQLANSTPPLGVIGSAIAPFARIQRSRRALVCQFSIVSVLRLSNKHPSEVIRCAAVAVVQNASNASSIPRKRGKRGRV